MDQFEELLDLCLDFPIPEMEHVPRRQMNAIVREISGQRISLQVKTARSTPKFSRAKIKSPTLAGSANLDPELPIEEDEAGEACPSPTSISPRRKKHRLSCFSIFQMSPITSNIEGDTNPTSLLSKVR